MPIFGPGSLITTDLRVGRGRNQVGMAIVLLAALSLGGGLLRVSTAAAAQAEGVGGADAADEGLDLWMPAAVGVGALVLLVLLLSDGRRRHPKTTVAGKATAVSGPAASLTGARGHGSPLAAHEGVPAGLPPAAATAARGGTQRSPDARPKILPSRPIIRRRPRAVHKRSCVGCAPRGKPTHGSAWALSMGDPWTNSLRGHGQRRCRGNRMTSKRLR